MEYDSYEYLQMVLTMEPKDFAGTVNADLQEIVMRYNDREAARFDWRHDSFDGSMHCNWSTKKGFSPVVRFERDLKATTFGANPREYVFVTPEPFEQLLYDLADSLVPDWG